MNLGCERIENFPIRQNRYFASFAFAHKEQARRLKDGGLLASGWRNAFAHNLMAGVISDILAECLGLPRARRDFVVSNSLIHDASKREQKDAVIIALAAVSKTIPGVTTDQLKQVQVDLRREQERGCPTDVRRVAGLDWRDFDEWGIPEKILRYVDSTLGTNMFTPEQASGPYNNSGLVEKETIVDWRERIAKVARRNPEQNQMVGNEFYGGKLAFDRLAEITEIIEAELHGEILKKHPELATKYAEPSSLNKLLRDRLCERIVNTRLRSDTLNQ